MDKLHVVKAPHGIRGLARIGAVTGIVAIAVVLWAVFASYRARATLREYTDDQAIVTVATTTPQALRDTEELRLPGSVSANYDAPIYARTSGYLRRWLVDIGTPVKAGQVLAEIDAPEVDQQLRQAQADVANAEANQKIARVTADRWRGLRNTDSVSKQEADEKISLADAGAAQLQAAQANVQRLRELSGFKKIVAPFDGVVTARNTDVGQLINAGSGSGPELFRIADIRQLRLYVHVPQTYAAMVQANIEAEVSFPDRPGRTYLAKVERTSNALDASRTLLAQLIVDNTKNELLPGAYAEVHFKVPASLQGATVRVPTNALLFRSDGLQVATVDPQGRVVIKPVTVGRDYGSDIEITQGLRASDRVILSPPDSLTDSTIVRVTPKTTPKAVAKS
ncbi:MAG TPA: efflux RND transporter periplasmic adaptor subunit [Steroidobacteraceae bacterium]|nr:efflux RND transporter periplasmic adaptor subunit [Steroidobacteraceae bacterium]